MKLVILDRNAIINIGKHLDGNSVANLSEIQALDIKENTISYMLSGLEGDSGRPQTPTERLSGINKDIRRAGSFFKHAKVDFDFFTRNQTFAAIAHSDEQVRIFSRYCTLVKYIQDNVYQPIKPEKKFEIRSKICELAVADNIPTVHPVVICGLAALYGFKDAASTLKKGAPSQPDIYKRPQDWTLRERKRIHNGLSDLMTIHHIASIRCELKNKHKKAQVIFFTQDEALRSFSKHYKLKNTRTRKTKNGELLTNHTWHPQPSLFPELNESQYKELLNWLKIHNTAVVSQ